MYHQAADRTILIAGAPGVGKSSMICQLLKEMGMSESEAKEKAPSGMNATGVTDRFTPILCPQRLPTSKGDISVMIVDTPGLGGKKGKVPKMAKQYGELAKNESQKVDTFVFCIEANNIRIDATIEQYLNLLFRIGKRPEELFDNLYFAITKCNTFKGNFDEINNELRKGLKNAEFQNDPNSEMQQVMDGRQKSGKTLCCFIDHSNAGMRLATLFGHVPKPSVPDLQVVDDKEQFQCVGDAMGMDIEDPADLEDFKKQVKKQEDEVAEERKRLQEELNKPGFWATVGAGIMTGLGAIGKTVLDGVTFGNAKTPKYSELYGQAKNFMR